MVEPVLYVGAERVFAGVTTGPMAAIVTECNCLGESLVEAESPSNGDGHLRNFERMSEASALMILGEHEDLGLSCKSSKRTGVENAIAISFEAGAEGVGLLFDCAVACTE